MRPLKKHKQSSGENKFSVNLGAILFFTQLKIIESLLEKKHNSKAHMRVFRALQALGMSNDKQLEEICLLSIKRVRSILLDLTKEGLVEQHEINANKGTYAYSVRISGYIPLLRDKIMQSKLNLEVKIETQRDKLSKLSKALGTADTEVKSQNHLLKKLIVASYQIDNMLLHFLLF